METRTDRHWGDRLADLFGAVALGAGAGGTTWLIAPRLSAVATALGLCFGWLLMRAVPGGEMALSIPAFEVVPLEAGDEQSLLLEDALAEPDADSRVVQLFAPDATPTAGQLQARIDRHLGLGEAEGWAAEEAHRADAGDALHAALDEIRRSLRRR